MTLNMSYQLQINLQQRSTLSAAIAIWNSQEVKDKISKWSDNRQRSGLKRANEEWLQLSKEVLIEVNQIVLPLQSKGELINIVKTLGEKIFNWSTYIWYEYSSTYKKKGDIIDYIREIYWTPIGTIDEVKILQSYWMTNPNLNVAVMYNIACKNALEENINDLWQRMPNSMKDYYDKFNRHANDNEFLEDLYYDQFILAYWKYLRNDEINHFIEYIISKLIRDERRRFVYNRNYSVKHNMFLLSVYNGWSTAVKYFWKELTREERDRSVLYSAYLIVIRSRFAYKSSYIRHYFSEKYVEIMIFLINQMTMDQKESFLRAELVPNEFNIEIEAVRSRILSMLLSIWPWQELFMSVFKNMLQYLEDDARLFMVILYEISIKIVEPCYAVENSKYQNMLYDFWFIIPGSIKRTMAHDFTAPNLMIYLLEIGDLSSIKMIFDDPEIADVRMQYIKFGESGYNLLIILDKYEILDQFIEKVLRSEEEKIYLKSLIDHISLCEEFVNDKEYYSANKLLNWKLETEEDRKQCKDYFKDFYRFLDWVCDTLKAYEGCVDKTKKETYRFFKWMLASEDDIASIKKEFIINSKSLIREVTFDNEFRLTLSENEAQKIRQILE